MKIINILKFQYLERITGYSIFLHSIDIDIAVNFIFIICFKKGLAEFFFFLISYMSSKCHYGNCSMHHQSVKRITQRPIISDLCAEVGLGWK